MKLDNQTVPVESKDLELSRFSREYLRENRPCVLTGYAKEWPALEKWTDLDYLVKKEGATKAGVYKLILN